MIEELYLSKILSKLKEAKQQRTIGKSIPKDGIEIINSFFCWIQQAVLSGEYYGTSAKTITSAIINECSNFTNDYDKEQIFELLKVNDDKTIEITFTEKDLDEDEAELRKFVKTFNKKYLSKFLELVNAVQSNLQVIIDNEIGFKFDINHLKQYKLKHELAELISSDIKSRTEVLQITLFELNILLAFIDEYLECSEEILLELKSIRKFLRDDLRNGINGEILDLIKQKAGFLEYKINYRNKRSPNAHLKIPKLPEPNAFNPFLSKLCNHYEKLDDKKIRKIKSNLQTVQVEGVEIPINVDNIYLEEIHNYNRFFCKISTDDFRFRKEMIDEALKLVKNAKKVPLSDFDKVAVSSFENLLFNTALSLNFKTETTANKFSVLKGEIINFLTDENNSKIHFLDDIYGKLKIARNNDNLLTNYYCFSLFIKFINDLVDFIRKEPDTFIDNSSEITEEKIRIFHNKINDFVAILSSLYQDSILQARANIERMIIHEIKPVYLLEKECLIDYKWQDGTSGKLFLDSSYILPINYKSITKEIERWEMFYDAQLNPLKNRLELAVGILSMKKEATNFEKKMKESEFKTVQIIAMFVSIATFVLLNVKIFDNKSGLQSFGILIGLSSCFFLFNLFFHLIIMVQVRGNIGFRKAFKSSGWMIIPPVVFALISLYILQREDQKERKSLKSTELNTTNNSSKKDSSLSYPIGH